MERGLEIRTMLAAQVLTCGWLRMQLYHRGITVSGPTLSHALAGDRLNNDVEKILATSMDILKKYEKVVDTWRGVAKYDECTEQGCSAGA